MQKIAIIIPCYNEEKRINIQQLQSLIDNTSVIIYFANDGSKDNTLSVLDSFCIQHPTRTEILNYSQNEGKANTVYKSVNFLLKEKNYDYIGYLDADFSTPPSEIFRILKELEEEKQELIFGSRVLLLNAAINRKWHRHVIGRVIITLINLKFKLGIYDTQCGAKIISTKLIKEAFSTPFFTSWLFDVEVFIRLKNKNLLLNAKEFPLNEWRDVEGSKLSWKTGIKIFRELYLLRKNY